MLWAIYREVLRDNTAALAQAGYVGVKLPYKTAVSGIMPWPSARLGDVKREEIPNRLRSRACLPEYLDDPCDVLSHKVRQPGASNSRLEGHEVGGAIRQTQSGGDCLQ